MNRIDVPVGDAIFATMLRDASAGYSHMQRRKSSETRRRLISAASSIATQEGLEAVSFSALARLTGMTKSGVYACFGSRDALLTALLSEYTHTLARAIATSGGQHPTGIRRLEALFAAWAQFLQTERWLARLIVHGTEMKRLNSLAVRVQVPVLVAEWHSAFFQCIEQSKVSGEIALDVNTEQMVFELFGLALTPYVFRSACNEDGDRRWLHAFRRIVSSVVRP